MDKPQLTTLIPFYQDMTGDRDEKRTGDVIYLISNKAPDGLLHLLWKLRG